jgi:hypothetical protein
MSEIVISGIGLSGEPIPVRQAVNTTPSAYMSAAGVAGPPSASSGAV